MPVSENGNYGLREGPTGEMKDEGFDTTLRKKGSQMSQKELRRSSHKEITRNKKMDEG